MINELVLEAKLLQVKWYLDELKNQIKAAGQSSLENCQEVTEEALEMLNQQDQQEGAR